MQEKKIIGVDIGGSHISAGYVDFSMEVPDPEIKRSKVNSTGTREEILGSWTACLEQLVQGADTRLGMAMPAPFDYENGISFIKEQGKFRALYQVNIKKELAYRLDLPIDNICFFNDAAAFLQGEAFVGGGNGNDRLMGLTLGTGLGSAFKTGPLAEDGGLWSSRFKDGIAEDYLGTGWFIDWAKKEAGLPVSGLKELLDNPVTQSRTKEALKSFGRNLGEFAAPYIKSKSIDRLIIGGNIGNAASLFLKETVSVLEENGLFPQITVSRLGEKAPLIGAASLWKRR
ncbi:ROK family protein [Negadavirga shengliensis]|uniref:ROK family protein n=1 Tax=Negadavirga shengliensis TaxID=1389218 RepID=A0ABV9T4B0_9BACT